MLAKNEGTRDRVVRAVLGGGLIAVSATSLGLGSGKPLGVAVALVGGVLLFTAAAGSCVLYRPFGIDTSK